MKNLAILGLMLASGVIFLPNNAFADSQRSEKLPVVAEQYQRQVQVRTTQSWRTRRHHNRRWNNDRGENRRRNGPWYGYRNYGQWRRSQVGNRRYRTVTRYYWDNGRRRTRVVRVY